MKKRILKATIKRATITGDTTPLSTVIDSFFLSLTIFLLFSPSFTVILPKLPMLFLTGNMRNLLHSVLSFFIFFLLSLSVFCFFVLYSFAFFLTDLLFSSWGFSVLVRHSTWVGDLVSDCGSGTMVQNNQEYRLRYWATRSSVPSFARTAQSFACSGLLASLAPSAALTHSLTLLTPSLVGK